MQAILGGHIMAASDSTGWAPHVASGRPRCWAPTAASAPSAGRTCRR
ncbi:MAG: hypothetical protein U1F17_14865 [Burkholderiaceae bacterium]